MMRRTPNRRQLSSRLRPPRMFTLASNVGSSTERLTAAWAARWATTSGRSASKRSPSRALRRSRRWKLAPGFTQAGLPVARLSTTVTAWPARTNASTTWEPMNPAPPVTRIFMPSRLAPGAAVPLDGLPEPVLHRDGRLPAQKLPRPGDVRLPHLRVVHRQGREDDFAPGAGQPENGLGQIEERHLPRVADVDRLVDGRPHEPPDPVHQVRDVGEGSGLGAVPVHREGLVPQRLADEGGDGPAVGEPHAGPVGVEDAHDARVHAVEDRKSVV